MGGIDEILEGDWGSAEIEGIDDIINMDDETKPTVVVMHVIGAIRGENAEQTFRVVMPNTISTCDTLAEHLIEAHVYPWVRSIILRQELGTQQMAHPTVIP